MEEKSISFRGKIRLISFISFALIALSVFAIVQSVKVAKYEKEIFLAEQRALISLDEYLGDISASLEKAAYISTPTMLSSLATELWRDSAEAKNSLSELPSSNNSIANTYKFLSQVGEYVMSLERKSANGEVLTEKERKQLVELQDLANELSEKISSMCYGMQNGTFSFEKKNTTLLKTSDLSSNVFDEFDDVEQTLSNLPSLVFDGPFSNHIENTEPKALKNKEEITKNKASKIAKDVCKSDELDFAFEEDGNIPCYVFKSENCTVAITKQGGFPLYMLNSDFAGEANIKYEDAVKKAKKYLEKIGYKNMSESYYFTDDGICTINFAYSQDGITCYADLIKVSVNLQNGEISSFDATGYLSSHKKRTVPKAKFTLEEGKEKLYNGLTVVEADTCFAPNDWGKESLCYEYLCKAQDGQDLLVYLNALTGEEENVLILLYSDGGVLTK